MSGIQAKVGLGNLEADALELLLSWQPPAFVGTAAEVRSLGLWALGASRPTEGITTPGMDGPEGGPILVRTLCWLADLSVSGRLHHGSNGWGDGLTRSAVACYVLLLPRERLTCTKSVLCILLRDLQSAKATAPGGRDAENDDAWEELALKTLPDLLDGISFPHSLSITGGEGEWGEGESRAADLALAVAAHLLYFPKGDAAGRALRSAAIASMGRLDKKALLKGGGGGRP